MMANTFQFGLTAFLTLLVMVDPLGLLPVFAALTADRTLAQRRLVMRRAIVTAFCIAAFFLAAGNATLRYMGVSMDAFTISGGILLFVTAMPMLFGQRGGLQSPQRDEPPAPDQDVAIFPLAIPLLAGPGVMTTLLLLMAQARGHVALVGALALATLLVFLVAWLALHVGERVIARIGEAGIHVATRVLGVALAALAVQFVLNGLTGYYRLLTAH